MTTKKERAEALARMTKAELVKTIHALDKRQTQLLNRVAELEADHMPERPANEPHRTEVPAFPWSTAEGS